LLITHIESAAFFRRFSRTATLGAGLRPDTCPHSSIFVAAPNAMTWAKRAVGKHKSGEKCDIQELIRCAWSVVSSTRVNRLFHIA